MITNKVICLGELADFTSSDLYRGFDNVPLSSLRIASYLNNPKGKSTDKVLYIALDGNKLVGYSSTWCETFEFENIKKRFAWMCGNWVHPDYRRQGIAMSLYKRVADDWGDDLMYSNFAIASKNMFDKTGRFYDIATLQGVKFYTRFCFEDILPPRKSFFKKMIPLLKFSDRILNALWDLKNRFGRLNLLETQAKVILNEPFGQSHEAFFNLHTKNDLFKRNVSSFAWILNYPWIKETLAAKKEKERFHFSVYAREFQNCCYSFYKQDHKLCGMAFITVRDQHLKVHYVLMDDQIVHELAQLLILKTKNEKIKTVTVYHEALKKAMSTKLLYWGKKSIYHTFFAGKKMVEEYPFLKSQIIHPGDGDSVFT